MRRAWPIVWGCVLVALGALFLADMLTDGRIDAGHLIGQWWPLILIALGLAILLEAVAGRGGQDARELALDLAGTTRADIRLDFGAGRLAVGPAASGRLVDGRFEGGVRHQRDGGRVRLWTDPSDAWWGLHWRGFLWRVGITREVPLRLEVRAGAAETDLDLTELRVTELDLHTGAAGTTVRLPRAGASIVRVEVGVSAVRFHVPEGVAVRIASRVGLGSTSVDERRFPRTATGWVTPGFDGAPNRVDIAVQGGLGSLVVE
jgi:hypothetical protein